MKKTNKQIALRRKKKWKVKWFNSIWWLTLKPFVLVTFISSRAAQARFSANLLHLFCGQSLFVGKLLCRKMNKRKWNKNAFRMITIMSFWVYLRCSCRLFTFLSLLYSHLICSSVHEFREETRIVATIQVEREWDEDGREIRTKWA